MLFIHPMWDHESQRVGKKECTPVGYALHVIAELIGFVGLLLFTGALVYLVYRTIAGTFESVLLWPLAASIGIGVMSELLYQYSWKLATRKHFRYDYERREASWDEAGHRRSYKWQP